MRPLRESDHPGFKRAMDAAYPTLGGAWKRAQFLSQIQHFAEGRSCIEEKGEVGAAVVSVVVDYNLYCDDHTCRQITGNGYLTTHDPHGDGVRARTVFMARCTAGPKT